MPSKAEVQQATEMACVEAALAEAMKKLQRTLRVWLSLPKLEPTMPKVARGVRKQHTLKPVCKRCAIYGAPFPPVTECDHAWLASDEAMA